MASANKLPPVNYDPETGLPTNGLAINMTGVGKRRGSRKNRKASRKTRKCGWFKNRKAASRKNRKASRKNRKASRKH